MKHTRGMSHPRDCCLGVPKLMLLRDNAYKGCMKVLSHLMLKSGCYSVQVSSVLTSGKSAKFLHM